MEWNKNYWINNNINSAIVSSYSPVGFFNFSRIDYLDYLCDVNKLNNPSIDESDAGENGFLIGEESLRIPWLRAQIN